MVEISHLPWARAGDTLVASTGYDDDYQTYGLLPFRVVKTNVFQYVYDLTTNITGFLPLGPYPTGAIPNVAQGYWVANQQLNVLSLANVTNLFLIQQNYEVIQAFIGVSPSYLRVYPQQPITQIDGYLDQSQTPGQSFPNLGYYDGFLSPYERPGLESELLVLGGYEPSFNFFNPVGIPITPRLNIFINRMVIAPIMDAKTAQAIACGTLHDPSPRIISVGAPQNQVAFNTSLYPGAKVFRVQNPAKPAATTSSNALSSSTPNPGGR
jgi:hypothetical protein